MKDLPLEQRDMLKNRLARHFKNFDREGNGTVAEDETKKEKKDKRNGDESGSESDDSEGDDFM
jgi:hypothetical protein